MFAATDKVVASSKQLCNYQRMHGARMSSVLLLCQCLELLINE